MKLNRIPQTLCFKHIWIYKILSFYMLSNAWHMMKYPNNGQALKQRPFDSEFSCCELFRRQFILSVLGIMLLGEKIPSVAKLST